MVISKPTMRGRWDLEISNVETIDRRVLAIDISNGWVESIEQDCFVDVELEDEEGEKAA